MTDKSFAANEIQLVIFRLGREEYGISILQVQEIKRMTDITRVPHTPDYIKGVMNLRGSVLPVIDLRKRLNLPVGEITDNTRIIIVRIEDVTVGLIVDAVSEVTAIPQNSIEPAQTFVGGIAADYISGVGKLDNRLLILLNLSAIVGTTHAETI